MTVDVSRETRLKAFHDLLLDWSERINLISPGSRADAWTRHIEDSTQIEGLVRQDDFHIVDLGSGGGLPAIPLAIALSQSHPGTRITAVESDSRKSAFLRTAKRTLGLENIHIINARSESLDPQQAQVVTARGFAPLDRLLVHAHRHLAPGGRALLHKGASAADEIAGAETHWTFRCVRHPSTTHPNATLLELSDIRHA